MIPVTITIEKNGGNLTFFPGDILSVDYASSVSLDGDEMSADEITVTVRQDNPDWLAQWSGVSRAAPVWLTLAGSAPRTEKYYYKSVQRVAKRDFLITAQSPLGRLASDFPGAVYNAKPLPDVIADVIGGVIPYACNSLLSAVRVYGWAPYQSRRESLHALAFAYSFLVRRNANQDLYFTVPDTVPYPIPDDNIFTGGSVSYSFGNAYARAEITATDWRADPSATEQTLYDNSGGVAANHNLVKFDAPMFDLKTSDFLSIDNGGAACGVNFAYVSGTGTLTGKPYSKYTSVVTVDGEPGADPLQVLSVTDAPLITSLNAASVGQRLLDCRNAPATVNADIIRTIQRPGDCVSFVDPFGDERTGHIAALSGSITSFDRASATIVCGYSPSWGAAYDAVFVLTDTDAAEWVVPNFLDGKKVRVVLIGGGQGGASGQHGTDANGKGCLRGTPGTGGRVLDFMLAVSAGQAFTYQCGTGGAGGTPTVETEDRLSPDTKVYASAGLYHRRPHGTGTFSATTLEKAIQQQLAKCDVCFQAGDNYYVSNRGTPGGDTAFGDFSTADEKAAPAPAGFIDVVDGVQYATPGPDNGVDGGQATAGRENGKKDNPAWDDVQTFAGALPWDTSQSWTSGGVGQGKKHHETSPEGTLDDWAFGGLGGGAAVGANGTAGQDAPYPYVGGNGGNGANAAAIFPPDALAFGAGGSGGHGGGESGVGGSAHSKASYPEGVVPTTDGLRGSGGSGSDGQSGANGCILIYYKKPDSKQFSFRVHGDGHLILTYYTPEPPPFYLDESKHLRYRLAEGETPPNYVIRNGHLYLSE